jgi:ribosomal protein S18 acetylase RimI-like enzyme
VTGRGRASGLVASPERLERVSNAFMLQWLERMPHVRIERVPGAFCALCPSLPELDFVNRIYGRPDDLAEAEALYRDAGLRPWAEWEGDGPSWPVVGEHAVVVGPASAPEPELDVREGEREVCAETFVRAVGAPDAHRGPVAAWDARLYVAYVDRRPAGAAALSLAEGIGHLANAATLPELRNRGVQTALIRRRIRDAAATGCELVSSGASAGSQSLRNLERSGLHVAYVKTAWRAPA